MDRKRTYTMTARAEQTEETRRRILQAAFDLQGQRLSSQIGLEAVADAAAVSVQTVLRHFGSRAGLFDAALAHANAQVAEERRTPVGDVPAAARAIVAHYERRGDLALMMLAQESTYDHVRRMAEAGKQVHRRWVEEVFGPHLAGLPPARAEELTDLLVVATDVYAWKLLRRDRGLSRTQTERRIQTLVSSLLTGTTSRKDH
jgi:AcrR family transcriptional regulator